MSAHRPGTSADAEVVRLEGEWDLARGRELERLLLGPVRDERGLIVDLGGTTFLDSTSLGMLLTAQQRCELRALRFALVVPPDTVYTVQNGLRLLGIHRHAPMFDSLEAAAAALPDDRRGGNKDAGLR